MNEEELSTAKRLEAIVSEDEADLRLDRWFKRHYPALQHSVLQKLLRKGQIRLEGRRVDQATRVQPGQKVRIPPGLEKEKEAASKGQGFVPPAKLARLRDMILYEDADVWVLNKPAGLAVQGGTGIKESLDDWLRFLKPEDGPRPRLVHRLDRETSGVLLIARTDFAAARLAAAFRTHAAQKIYWAVTCGVPKPLAGSVSIPLVKDGQLVRAAQKREEGAKAARTLYRVVEQAGNVMAFVALAPLTGRTHQLRVHLALLGTPIWGDSFYGGEDLPGIDKAQLGKGLHLHARRLVVPHPRSGIIDVTAPLSPALRKTWRWFQFDEKAQIAFDDIADV